LGRLPKGAPLSTLESHYVRGLQSFRTFGDFKFNSLPLVQGSITISLNGREMDEYVLSRLALNKTESLACIEPLYCSLFFH
jgi:hypothetical protein